MAARFPYGKIFPKLAAILNSEDVITEGVDMIGQELRVNDVAVTLIGDRLTLVEVLSITKDEIWRQSPRMYYRFIVSRYKSKIKEVKMSRRSHELFKVAPEIVSAAVLSGRLT